MRRKKRVTKLVRIDVKWHRRLKKLAKQEHKPMTKLLDELFPAIPDFYM